MYLNFSFILSKFYKRINENNFRKIVFIALFLLSHSFPEQVIKLKERNVIVNLFNKYTHIPRL